MRFACEQCQAKYSIPDARVAGKVVRLRCQRCGNEIIVRGPPTEAAAAAAPPEKAAPEKAAPERAAPAKAASPPAEEDPASEKPDEWGSSTKIASLADIERIRQAANAEAAAAAPPPQRSPPPLAKAPETAEWYAIVKGAQIGPFTRAVVAGKITAQEFTARTYAWRDGMSDWLRLQTIPEFAAAFAPAAASKAPAPARKSEPQKMAALVDPKIAAGHADAPWSQPGGAVTSLKDAALADDIAELFTPPEPAAPGPQTPFANAFDSDPHAPPRESTSVFMAAAGLVNRKRRQRLAAIAIGVVLVALLTVIGLDLGGVIEIPALGLAYSAFGIDNPHSEGAAAQFNSNLSEAEKQKLRDGLLGKKKVDAQKPIAISGGKAAAAKPDDAAKDPAAKPNDEQKMLNELFDDSQKAEVKVEAPQLATPAQDQAQGIGAPEITRVVEANQKAVKFCLERALSKGQPASGRMEIEFTIEPTGVVSAVAMKTAKLKGSDFAECTTEAVKSWKFPHFSGAPVPVIYPFILSAGM